MRTIVDSSTMLPSWQHITMKTNLTLAVTALMPSPQEIAKNDSRQTA